jgi:tetraacyldisaccharide 4'-kinase
MRTLSTIFTAGVNIRNALYDRRMLKVNRLARPVVSIGNISVGGSGKTPFVIALGEILKQQGASFDVLSRGYRRKSSAVALVDPQGSPEQFGDEPLLIARKLQAPVVVGADRYQAGLWAEKNLDTKLHLLDDGFQHRRLHRDFDIVMLPASDLHDFPLPLGRLREPVSSLRRADAAVMPEDASEQDKALARSCMKEPHNLWNARRVLEMDQIAGKAVAFCGIARSEQFFSQLRSLRIELAATIAFSDHHHYSSRDIDRLLRSKAESGGECFLTTEKDSINLGALATHLKPLHVARLRLEIDSALAGTTTLKTLEQRCSCRF